MEVVVSLAPKKNTGTLVGIQAFHLFFCIDSLVLFFSTTKRATMNVRNTSMDDTVLDIHKIFPSCLDQSHHSTPFDEAAMDHAQHIQVQKHDIHRCNSVLCQVCSNDHCTPTFLKVHPSQTMPLPKLPSQWWEYAPDDSDALLGVLSNWFCHFTVVEEGGESSSDTEDGSVESLHWLSGDRAGTPWRVESVRPTCGGATDVPFDEKE